MKLKILIGILVLSATAYAGFLPLLHDRPKRDNANDPASKPLSGPVVVLPTLTPTPTAVPSCSGSGPDTTLYNFESCVGAWTYESVYTPMTAISNSAPSCFGTKSLSGNVNLVHGGSQQQFAFILGLSSAPPNWTGRSIVAYYYAPPGHGASFASVYVKTGGSWTITEGPQVTAPAAGGWSALNLNLSGLLTANAILETGVWIRSAAADPDGVATYRMDAFDVVGGPTPAATPTPALACGPVDPSDVAKFDATTEGWAKAMDGGLAAGSFTIANSATACLGPGSMAVSTNFAHACNNVKISVGKNFAPSLNFTGKSLEARVFVPAGYKKVSAGFVVKTESAYNYHQSPLIAAGENGWTVINYDLSGFTPAAQADIKEVDININSAGSDPDGNATFLLDAVRTY